MHNKLFWPAWLLAGLLGLTAVFLLPQPTALAQGESPTPAPTPTGEPPVEDDIPAVYIVQEGDTLFSIAEQFGTTIEVLQQLNGISDPALLAIGQQLILPGGGGAAVATLVTIQVGDTLAGLAADFNTTVAAIVEANRLVRADGLPAGRSLSIISRTGSADAQPITGQSHVVQEGESLLLVAARYGLSPAALAAANDLDRYTRLFPGQRLRLPGEGRYQFLPGTWQRIQVGPLPVSQGNSLAVYVENSLAGLPEGTFLGQQIRFAPFEQGFVALIGIDAFTEPGDYTLRLSGSGSRPWRPFEQAISIDSGGYETQFITVPDDLAYLLAPEIRGGEDAFLATIYGQFSDQPLWNGRFQLPLTNTVTTAGYGLARSYNGGPIEIYHSGVDFAGPVGTPIYAPADGRVVYSGTLELRGNTLIIDHGLGVMTGYYHLDNIRVSLDEMVTAGQLIAQGGDTGLSTGPHLHWDLRILNVPVDGLQWVTQPFLMLSRQSSDD